MELWGNTLWLFALLWLPCTTSSSLAVQSSGVSLSRELFSVLVDEYLSLNISGSGFAPILSGDSDVSLQRLFTAQADLAIVGRPLTIDDLHSAGCAEAQLGDACQGIKVGPIQAGVNGLVFGVDYLSWFVTPGNPVTNLDRDQLDLILTGIRQGAGLTWEQAFPAVDFGSNEIATQAVEFIVGATGGTRDSLEHLLDVNLTGIPAVDGTTSAIIAAVDACNGTGISILSISSVIDRYSVLAWHGQEPVPSTQTYPLTREVLLYYRTNIELDEEGIAQDRESYHPARETLRSWLQWLNQANSTRFAFTEWHLEEPDNTTKHTNRAAIELSLAHPTLSDTPRLDTWAIVLIALGCIAAAGGCAGYAWTWCRYRSGESSRLLS